MRTGALLLALAVTPGRAAPAAVVTETYTNRAAFESRLGGAVDAVTFDDIDTRAVDPVAFAADRYADTHGIVVTGERGQFASRAFGFPDDYPTSSAPNQYAPGPVNLGLGGGNQTDVTFVVASQPAAVAGFGAVFSDPDLGAFSGVAVFDADGAQLGSALVPAADRALVFRGIVAVDDETDAPVAAIARVRLVNGTGWPAGAANDGVPLDDFVFGLPVMSDVTTTTTTMASTTTTTTLCPAAPAADCRRPTVSGRARLLAWKKTRVARSRLVWVWGRGAATTREDFGDPAGATGFALCTWDATGLRLETAVPAGGACAGRRCWRTTRSGFVYRDRNAASGVRLLRLEAGGDGSAQVTLVARGAALRLPALSLATPVTTQLVRSEGGGCWEARFSVARRSTASRFRAISD
jgi:hypothetical protein